MIFSNIPFLWEASCQGEKLATSKEKGGKHQHLMVVLGRKAGPCVQLKWAGLLSAQPEEAGKEPGVGARHHGHQRGHLHTDLDRKEQMRLHVTPGRAVSEEIGNRVTTRATQVAKKAPNTKAPVQPTKTTNVNKQPKPIASVKPVQMETLAPKEPYPAPEDVSMKEENLCQAFSDALLSKIEDICNEDWENPQLCSDYVKDIYQYLRQLEVLQTINPHFLDGRDINRCMGAIPVDWLVQVRSKCRLLQETLHMCIAMTDRFLQHTLTKYLMELTLIDYGHGALSPFQSGSGCFLPVPEGSRPRKMELKSSSITLDTPRMRCWKSCSTWPKTYSHPAPLCLHPFVCVHSSARALNALLSASRRAADSGSAHLSHALRRWVNVSLLGQAG
ncbi:hypothetical protein QTO34_019697 [Cnephaeus nilssonii]|uniref:Cyclin N-terminal domain-containing protein n=1 Tax=Cnephaeus nilssonii TaxID=3371016 RepID=A0AA40HX69_CNENI|nr:hypothetical protein QTO34_019697 [Eptesicus nilssonii]